MGTRRITAELVADVGALHGEGPAWDARGGEVLWVDITGRGFVRTRPDGSGRTTLLEREVCVVVPRTSGGYAFALQDGFYLQDAADAPPHRIWALPDIDAPHRFNDGKCDPAGRLWAGTMAYDATPGAGTLYRLDPDGAVQAMIAGVTISNGLAWSADGRQMFYIDTPTQRIDAFAFDLASGEAHDRRPLVAIPETSGLPDGMAIDDAGCLWVALWNGSAVHRYAPDGRLDTIVELPVTQVTSCCFGGARLDELYITTSTETLTPERRAAQPQAGGLFRVRPGVTGQDTVPFAG